MSTPGFRPGQASFFTAVIEEEGEPVIPVVPPSPSPVSYVALSAEARVIEPNEVPESVQRAVASTARTHLIASGAWGWEEVRDYVVTQVELRWGAQPRDPLKEAGIFKGFVSRWGGKAESIARAAFEVHGGMWKGAPVQVGRFAKGSDPYFAEIIAQHV